MSTGISAMITVSILGGQLTNPQIAVGKDHTVVLRADGTVWAWGSNADGQLGDGTFTYRSYPVQMRKSDGTMFTNIVDMAGDTFTLLLEKDGAAWLVGELEGVTTAAREEVTDPETYVPEYCPNWYCNNDDPSTLVGTMTDKVVGVAYGPGASVTVDDTNNPLYDDEGNPTGAFAQLQVYAEPVYDSLHTQIGYSYNGVQYIYRDETNFHGYYVPYDLSNMSPEDSIGNYEYAVYADGSVVRIKTTQLIERVYTGEWHCNECNLTWNVTSTDPFMCECGQENDNGHCSGSLL